MARRSRLPADPLAIGPENDRHITRALRSAELAVCGWGKLADTRGPEVLGVIRDAGHVPFALRLNRDSTPAHPLYLPAALRPFPMELNGG